jgi:hypothetical protein
MKQITPSTQDDIIKMAKTFENVAVQMFRDTYLLTYLLTYSLHDSGHYLKC